MSFEDTLRTPVIIGVDVGGTNTDAAVIKKTEHHAEVMATVKTLTTADVTTGVRNAVYAVLGECAKIGPISVTQINIGTTHFINAVVQGKGLSKVSVIRLCGTASRALPPYSDFPSALKDVVCGSVHLCDGGYRYDGKEIDPVDPNEISNEIDRIRDNGITNIVVSGVFANVRAEQEEAALKMIREFYPEASVTLSHWIGEVGLLERENAAVLNECLKRLCEKTVTKFHHVLSNIGVNCPIFLTQNDGTIISSADAMKFPVRTFASGPTNSMRGAAFLSNVKDAIVVDIGGTTTDVGVLKNNFPRGTLAQVKVAGVRVNSKMPDVISINLGGGSYVTSVEDQYGNMTGIEIGPSSTGYNLMKEALAFGHDRAEHDRRLTATDIAVAKGRCKMGTRKNLDHLSKELLDRASAKIISMIENAIEKVKASDVLVPVILVGGGSILVDKGQKIAGTSEVIIPDLSQVANAIGAGLSQISNYFASLEDTPGKHKHTEGKADYSSTSAKTPKIKMNPYWEKERGTAEERGVKWHPVDLILDKQLPVLEKQCTTSFGERIMGDHENTKVPVDPYIDPSTGEWILSEWDIEAIVIGAGIFGCGGGGNSHLGRLLALKTIRSGGKIRVISPDLWFENADPVTDLVGTADCMGAPFVAIEQLASYTETVGAFQCVQELYSIGGYEAGVLENIEHADIQERPGIKYISDFKTNPGKSKNIVALMVCEIGGMNAIEPLLLSSCLGLPVVDADWMGRAFPELQMSVPYFHGVPWYPAALVDDKGRRAVVLEASSPQKLEDHFRDITEQMGGSAGLCQRPLNKDELLNYTVLYSISRAHRLGDAVLRSRIKKTCPIAAILNTEMSVHILTGQVRHVHLETSGGFTSGKVIIEGREGFSGETILVEFKNEHLVIFPIDENEKPGEAIACVPDLITLVDADTGEPIPSEELSYGMVVAVLVLAAVDPLKTEEALKYVGPQAFQYGNVTYVPIGQAYPVDPVAPKKLN